MATSEVIITDHGMDELGRRIESYTREHAAVSVGWQGAEAQEQHGEGLTNVMIASVLEYGTLDGRIPERSVVRATIEENRAEIAAFAGRLLNGVMMGKLDRAVALRLLGEKIVALMRKRILSGIDPPNAPSTIAAKGSDKPWIDTGQLINALSYLVTIQ